MISVKLALVADFHFILFHFIYPGTRVGVISTQSRARGSHSSTGAAREVTTRELRTRRRLRAPSPALNRFLSTCGITDVDRQTLCMQTCGLPETTSTETT
jgi:hypothetical protein